MTGPDLDAIVARADAATEGPWEQNGYVVHTSHGIGDVVADAGLSAADARFIAHARTDVLNLVAEIRSLLRTGRIALPDTSEHPRTVGDIRKAIEGLPDDAQMFVNVSGHMEDYAVDEVWASEQIPDDEPWPTDERTTGLEIHLGLFPEQPSAQEAEASGDAVAAEPIAEAIREHMTPDIDTGRHS